MKTPPAVVIRLALEERPEVRQEAVTEGESKRLEDWIKSKPQLHRLVYDAVQLMRRAA
jgi:hypothetical protein